ncbi:hypothetical protein CSW59_08310 [Caulobacter sp. BP25]|nr:hypothetical protein CSW59_08310 [Caulobacter sp. BP25]
MRSEAAISVWGADRVGVHLAPRADSHAMGDSDLAATGRASLERDAESGNRFRHESRSKCLI